MTKTNENKPVSMTAALAAERTAANNQALAGATVAAGVAAFQGIKSRGIGKASLAAAVATVVVGGAAAAASSWLNRTQKDSSQGHQR